MCFVLPSNTPKYINFRHYDRYASKMVLIENRLYSITWFYKK